MHCALQLTARRFQYVCSSVTLVRDTCHQYQPCNPPDSEPDSAPHQRRYPAEGILSWPVDYIITKFSAEKVHSET